MFSIENFCRTAIVLYRIILYELGKVMIQYPSSERIRVKRC